MESSETIGRWTEEEHQKFLEAYKIYGKNWKMIQKFIGTRNAAQARSHAQKYFAKLKKKQTTEFTKTQECTPISSPSSGPICEKEEEIQLKKTKGEKRVRRLLYQNEEYSEPPNKIKLDQTAKIIESEKIEMKPNDFNVASEVQCAPIESRLPDYPQIPLVTNEEYERDLTALDPWERELNIDKFQMRIASINLLNGSIPIPQSNDEDGPVNKYLDITGRQRTLSSMIE